MLGPKLPARKPESRVARLPTWGKICPECNLRRTFQEFIRHGVLFDVCGKHPVTKRNRVK